MIQNLFPNNHAVFQDNNALIHTTGIVQSWFGKHEDELQHFPWTAQSLLLKITEPLWSVFGTRLRNRSPPPKSVKEL
jgi:hypothetical protein